jgi:hypothetical protein
MPQLEHPTPSNEINNNTNELPEGTLPLKPYKPPPPRFQPIPDYLLLPPSREYSIEIVDNQHTQLGIQTEAQTLNYQNNEQIRYGNEPILPQLELHLKNKELQKEKDKLKQQ